MPKKMNPTRRRERHLRIREDRRREPDLRKIANTVIALALAQAEKEAEAQQGTSSSARESDDA